MIKIHNMVEAAMKLQMVEFKTENDFHRTVKIAAT